MQKGDSDQITPIEQIYCSTCNEFVNDKDGCCPYCDTFLMTIKPRPVSSKAFTNIQINSSFGLYFYDSLFPPSSSIYNDSLPLRLDSTRENIIYNESRAGSLFYIVDYEGEMLDFHIGVLLNDELNEELMKCYVDGCKKYLLNINSGNLAVDTEHFSDSGEEIISRCKLFNLKSGPGSYIIRVFHRKNLDKLLTAKENKLSKQVNNYAGFTFITTIISIILSLLFNSLRMSLLIIVALLWFIYLLIKDNSQKTKN